MGRRDWKIPLETPSLPRENVTDRDTGWFLDQKAALQFSQRTEVHQPINFISNQYLSVLLVKYELARDHHENKKTTNAQQKETKKERENSGSK